MFISLGFAGWSWNSVPSVLERVPCCWMGLEYHVNFKLLKGLYLEFEATVNLKRVMTDINFSKINNVEEIVLCLYCNSVIFLYCFWNRTPQVILQKNQDWKLSILKDGGITFNLEQTLLLKIPMWIGHTS